MQTMSYFDIFGKEYHFYIDKKRYFKEIFVGIMSFVMIIILIIIVYFYGKPMWYHTSPSITSSSILMDYAPLINLSDSIFFAFQLTDGTFNRGTPNLYMSLNYLSWVFTNNQSSTNEDIPVLNCSILYDVNKTEYKKIKDYKCINLTDRAIGGNWDGAFIKQLSLRISHCPYSQFTYNSSVCTTYENFQKTIETRTKLYLSYFLPVLYQDPDNYTNPIKVQYEYNTVDITPDYTIEHTINFGEFRIRDCINYFFDYLSDSVFYQVENNVIKQTFYQQNNFIEGRYITPLYIMTLVG